ncbi:glycosyltransferase ['Paenibacillus yunnanensis' Narsing Rao et al. 2020]|uniref:glycosyltransferase n=1 Tax=Paenibacillus tengchongensis TaxID=2608684 RepID=UPI00124F5E95|nr:glycosyltransferase family A protein [Paenibacillus tengchongensis]
MGAGAVEASSKQGVSIITCTNRRGYLRNLFHNFTRQRYKTKELIVVVNNDSIPLAPYLDQAKRLRHVHIYRMPGSATLGACLNFAVRKAKYSYIAKFDDDDYYARHYLTDSLQALHTAKADVIGKRAHYMYLRGSGKLILRFAQDEHRQVSKLPGATLLIRRSVLHKVPFPDRNVGEDDLFCIRSRKRGYKVYSAGRFNFVAIRRRNSAGHTWIISDKELLAHHKTIPEVKDYRKYVQRKPKGHRP